MVSVGERGYRLLGGVLVDLAAPVAFGRKRPRPVPAAGLRTRAASDGCRTRERPGSVRRPGAVVERADRSGWPQSPARRLGGPRRARRLSAVMHSMIARTRARSSTTWAVSGQSAAGRSSTPAGTRRRRAGGSTRCSAVASRPRHPADQRSVTRRPASIRSMIITSEPPPPATFSKRTLWRARGSVVTDTREVGEASHPQEPQQPQPEPLQLEQHPHPSAMATSSPTERTHKPQKIIFMCACERYH
jgi:hypothetical protein